MSTYRIDLTGGELDALTRVIAYCSGILQGFEEHGQVADRRSDELFLIGRDLDRRATYIWDGQP